MNNIQSFLRAYLDRQHLPMILLLVLGFGLAEDIVLLYFFRSNTR